MNGGKAYISGMEFVFGIARRDTQETGVPPVYTILKSRKVGTAEPLKAHYDPAKFKVIIPKILNAPPL